jgi:hypothetical protein
MRPRCCAREHDDVCATGQWQAYKFDRRAEQVLAETARRPVDRPAPMMRVALPASERARERENITCR